MVIDDHPHMRDILASFLWAEGHEFALCPDGTSALERLAREPFDLVVTDLRLPDLPGLAVVRRSKELRPSTPVALITGADNAVPAVELVRYGIDYLLAKPFTRQQFMRVVASALAQPV
jgi:two-component system response regulator MprA